MKQLHNKLSSKIIQFPIIWYVGLVVLSIPIILPYFHPGYFPTHDGEWAVVRLADMFRELRDFQFPARYSGNLDFGYGYPLFEFAYPFPYYLGFLFHFVKLGFVDTVKLLFAVTVPTSAIFFFVAADTIWKNKFSAFVLTIFYLYLPYRLVDLYARGSIGESFAFVLYPVLFYCLLKYIETKKTLFGLWFAIFFAILIGSHNIMAVYFFPFIVGYLIVLYFSNKKAEITRVILFTLLGFGLAAFFWLPALYEKQYILLSKIPIADRNLNYVSPLQLIIPKIGYGIPNDPKYGFSYQLGFPQLLLFLLTLVFFIKLFFQKTKRTFYFYFSAVFLIVLLCYGFLLFSPSAFFWKHVPLFSDINYPWTLLLPLGFLVSLFGGYLFSNRATKYVAIILAIVCVVYYLPYAKPQYFVNRGDDFYITNDATTTSSSEYTPLWVKTLPLKRPDIKVVSINGKSLISNVLYNSKRISFATSSKIPDTVRINTIYYPGWKIFVDGSQTSISDNNQFGVMDIHVGTGNHSVVGTFSETPLRIVADIISLISFVFVTFLLLKNYVFKKV